MPGPVIWNEEVGAFLSEDHRRFAEIINDYEPTLFLVFIPPAKRDPEDKHPYAIVHMPEGQEAYPVMILSETEMENPQAILARLFLNDREKGDPAANLAAMEIAAKAMRLHKQAEEEEAQRDLAASVLRSPLHTYRHNGKIYQ